MPIIYFTYLHQKVAITNDYFPLWYSLLIDNQNPYPTARMLDYVNARIHHRCKLLRRHPKLLHACFQNQGGSTLIPLLGLTTPWTPLPSHAYRSHGERFLRFHRVSTSHRLARSISVHCSIPKHPSNIQNPCMAYHPAVGSALHPVPKSGLPSLHLSFPTPPPLFSKQTNPPRQRT